MCAEYKVTGTPNAIYFAASTAPNTVISPNFHTRKLSEITVFYAVKVHESIIMEQNVSC